jgi:hypothetical protein
MIYGEQLKLNRGNNQVTVSTKKFPVGIVVFTVFDYEGVERSERLIFVNGGKGLKIEITPDKKQYLPREQVRLNVKTRDAEGHPVGTKLSLAVVDDQLMTFADDKQDNILSSMLLSSELKAKFRSPRFTLIQTNQKLRGRWTTY